MLKQKSKKEFEHFPIHYHSLSIIHIPSGYYGHNGSGQLITAAQGSNLKRSELWKSVIHRHVLYEKTKAVGRMQSLGAASRKQLILNCKHVNQGNLQLGNP